MPLDPSFWDDGPPAPPAAPPPPVDVPLERRNPKWAMFGLLYGGPPKGLPAGSLTMLVGNNSRGKTNPLSLYSGPVPMAPPGTGTPCAFCDFEKAETHILFDSLATMQPGPAPRRGWREKKRCRSPKSSGKTPPSGRRNDLPPGMRPPRPPRSLPLSGRR